MDHRIGYRRPLRTAALLRKKRLRARLCIGAAIVIAAVTAACTWEPGAAHPAGSTAAAPLVQVALNSTAPAAAGATRRIYPYSIIPGGVATREDLSRRVKTDAVVAEHYATFDIKKAHAVTNDKARAVHVSYRKGDKVYWTAKTVMLTPGETLLSDGSNEIRGRCGNRISTKAMLPVAMNEPTAAELDESMNVALDGAPEGGLENTAFAFGDDVPGGNPNAFTTLPGFGQTNTGPAEPFQRTGMPSVPFSAPNGSGLVPTSYLTVSAPPGGTVAIPVTPDTIATPAAPAASTPAVPVATPDVPATTPVVPVAPVTPVPVTPVAPVTPVTPVTPVHVDTPVTPELPVTPVTPVTPAIPVTPGTPTADPVPPVTPALPEGEVPEPGTLWLAGAALAMLFLARKKVPSSLRRDS